jgi:hypothetical protein
MASFSEKLRAFNAVKPSTGKPAKSRTENAWLMETSRTPSTNYRGTRTTINGFTAFKAGIEATPALNEVTKKAFVRAKEAQVRELEKKDKKKIRLLKLEDAPSCTVTRPTQASKAKKEVVKCKATGLNNKPCPYKASCGDFCKRHAP